MRPVRAIRGAAGGAPPDPRGTGPAADGGLRGAGGQKNSSTSSSTSPITTLVSVTPVTRKR